MTDREKLAAQLLAAILSNPNDHTDGEGDIERHVKAAFDYTDGFFRKSKEALDDQIPF